MVYGAFKAVIYLYFILHEIYKIYYFILIVSYPLISQNSANCNLNQITNNNINNLHHHHNNKRIAQTTLRSTPPLPPPPPTTFNHQQQQSASIKLSVRRENLAKLDLNTTNNTKNHHNSKGGGSSPICSEESSPDDSFMDDEGKYTCVFGSSLHISLVCF